MRTKIYEISAFGDSLWLVEPDHPETLSVVWLVLGVIPDDPHSLTIPIKRGNIPLLVEALGKLTNKELSP